MDSQILLYWQQKQFVERISRQVAKIYSSSNRCSTWQQLLQMMTDLNTHWWAEGIYKFILKLATLATKCKVSWPYVLETMVWLQCRGPSQQLPELVLELLHSQQCTNNSCPHFIIKMFIWVSFKQSPIIVYQMMLLELIALWWLYSALNLEFLSKNLINPGGSILKSDTKSNAFIPLKDN